MTIISRLLTLFNSKLESAMDRMEDPRQMLDYAYGQQMELLLKTKRGLIEVATSRVQLEREAKKLRDQIPHVEGQAFRALDAGREDLARIALHRKQTILTELDHLDGQVQEVDVEEKRLGATAKQLAVHIEEFRTRRGAMAARYTAAQAQVRVSEALSGVSSEFADLTMALGRAAEKTERMQARAAAIGHLLDVGSLSLPGGGSDLVEQELISVTVEGTVEDELAELKGRIAEHGTRKSIGSGSR